MLEGMWKVKTVYEVSDGNKESIRNWIRGRSGYILVKNSFAFCPFPEMLCEAAFKGDGLINMMVETSQQHRLNET